MLTPPLVGPELDELIREDQLPTSGEAEAGNGNGRLPLNIRAVRLGGGLVRHSRHQTHSRY